jgi:MFS family permease
MVMKDLVLVLRAIGVEFAKRIYVPVTIIAAIVAVIMVAGVILLTTLSGWWWILAILVFIGVIIMGIILTVVAVILKLANPRQTSIQKKGVKSFVDKLQNLSEITQTPKFILLFYVVRDIVSRREDGFVKTTIRHTLSLRQDFEALRNLFA